MHNWINDLDEFSQIIEDDQFVDDPLDKNIKSEPEEIITQNPIITNLEAKVKELEDTINEMQENKTVVSDTDHEIELLESSIEFRENLKQLEEDESVTYSDIYIDIQSDDEFETSCKIKEV